MIYNKHSIFTDKEIKHGFFGKKGGVSDGCFFSLNISPYSGDTKKNIESNIKTIETEFKGKLCLLKQVHGNKCIKIEDINCFKSDIKADAMVTNQQSVILGIQTADCCPVLLKTPTANGKHVIGAAHAGWGGALSGVLENTIDSMLEFGADINNISAAIGPTISQSSYEVSKGFIKPFLENNELSEQFFKSGRNDKLHFDLSGYVVWRLSLKGINNIHDICCDTYTNPNEYFSYRRSTHNGEINYGRQLSAIVI